MLLTFLITLIVYSTKKVHKTYWCSSSITYQEKRRDWILRIFTCNEKDTLYLPIISISHKTIWYILNIKSNEFKIKNAKFLKSFFYFLFNFLDNTSHKFWDQSPLPHYQCCLQLYEAVSWHKVYCCYFANILQDLVEGRDLIYFCKVDHSRIFRNFFRN